MQSHITSETELSLLSPESEYTDYRTSIDLGS